MDLAVLDGTTFKPVSKGSAALVSALITYPAATAKAMLT
jgi:hypothetical protein